LIIAKRNVRAAPYAEPNVIPFIDVLLVLLIVFMVTAPQSTVDHNLDLPSERTYPTPISPVIVDVGADLAALSIDGESVPLENLASAALEHARDANPQIPLDRVYADARILVRANQSTAYGNVVHVLDELQRARFAQVGIFAQQADES